MSQSSTGWFDFGQSRLIENLNKKVSEVGNTAKFVGLSVITGIGLFCGKTMYDIYGANKTRRLLQQKVDLTRDIQDGSYAKYLILQKAKTSYKDKIKDQLNGVKYIMRKEEFIVDRKLHSMLDDNNIFALVVYGSKGVGKSTLLRKVITDLFEPPESDLSNWNPWWYVKLEGWTDRTPGKEEEKEVKNDDDDEPNSNKKKKSGPILPIFCELQLDNIKEVADVYRKIANELVGDASAGKSIVSYLNRIKAEECNEGQSLLLYFHITALQNQRAYDSLISVAREIGEKKRVGVLIELSKCWIFSSNQSSCVKKLQIKPLSNSDTEIFVEKLAPNSQRDKKLLYEMVQGRPRLIALEGAGGLDEDIHEQKNLITRAFKNLDEKYLRIVVEMAVNDKPYVPKEDEFDQFKELAADNVLEFEAISKEFFIDEPIIRYILRHLNDEKNDKTNDKHSHEQVIN